jgi:hypothetical protein
LGSTHSQPWLQGVSSQLQSPAPLDRRRSRSLVLDMRLGGPHGRSGCRRNRKQFPVSGGSRIRTFNRLSPILAIIITEFSFRPIKNQNRRVSGPCPSPGILRQESRALLLPTTGEGGETPIPFGPLESVNLNPVVYIRSWLQIQRSRFDSRGYQIF